MKPVDDWKHTLRHAWSVRWMAAAGLLTGGEALINVFGVENLPIPRWARALLVLFTIGGAFVARLLAQPERPR